MRFEPKLSLLSGVPPKLVSLFNGEDFLSLSKTAPLLNLLGTCPNGFAVVPAAFEIGGRPLGPARFYSSPDALAVAASC